MDKLEKDNTVKNNNTIDNLVTNIEKNVQEIFKSENFKNYLNVMSRFYNYSLNNQILIYSQKPDATLIAGFRSWGTMGRRVKKDSNIHIIAPYKVILKDDNGNERYDEKTGEKLEILRYRTVNVYDVSDTYGKDLPKLTTRLNFEVEDKEKLINILEGISICPITYESIGKSTDGYYNKVEKKIVVNSDMSSSDIVNVLIHEISHSRLHADLDNKLSKQQKEVEAESLTYIISDYLGLDTSKANFNYISKFAYGMENEKLKESLNRIRTEAKNFIQDIDKYSEKQLSKDKVSKNNLSQLKVKCNDLHKEDSQSKSYVISMQ